MAQEPKRPLSSLAIAGLVCGILAWLVFPFSLLNPLLMVVLGLAGIVLSIIALGDVNRGIKRGKGAAIAGIVIASLSVVWIAFFYLVLSPQIAQVFSQIEGSLR